MLLKKTHIRNDLIHYSNDMKIEETVVIFQYELDIWLPKLVWNVQDSEQ